MKMVPFTAAHLDLFEMRPSEKDRLDLDPSARARMESLAQFGMGGTMLHDGRIIGIIGYYEMWPGVIEIWAFPSIYVPQYATIYLRTVKRYIGIIESTYQPHRLQTSSIADDLHDRWMKFLGFNCEGHMKQYSVNRLDHRMWSKVYPKE